MLDPITLPAMRGSTPFGVVGTLIVVGASNTGVKSQVVELDDPFEASKS